MAESEKCPFCHTGTVMWIYESPMVDEIYGLKCTVCDAYGEYQKPEKYECFCGMDCGLKWCPGAY